jgi:hypothetical protein
MISYFSHTCAQDKQALIIQKIAAQGGWSNEAGQSEYQRRLACGLGNFGKIQS